MELETLLKMKPEFAYEPCLYIIKQTDSINAYRCGLSGSSLHQDIDRVYGADRPGALTGLLSRMSMYLGFYTPLVPKIYACLRVKKQLVALQTQRTSTDFAGNTFNVDRGNYTLVRAMEALMHERMDARGLRWKSDKKNELFVPKKSVAELIAVMRTIPGEEMYIFGEDSIETYDAYRGGRLDNRIQTDTQVRTLPFREAASELKVPTITIKLSRKAIEQLRAGNPKRYESLIDIIKSVAGLQEAGVISKPKPPAPPAPRPSPPPPPTPAPTILKLPPATIAALTSQGPPEAKARAISKVVAAIPRRVTRSQTKATKTQQQPRRSARLAANT